MENTLYAAVNAMCGPESEVQEEISEYMDQEITCDWQDK